MRTLTGARLQVQGHRGGFQPENTLKAFKQAIEHRIEGIELDVSCYYSLSRFFLNVEILTYLRRCGKL